MDSREKDNKGNRRLTVHVHSKLAHLIVLPSHLDLQVLDLLLALTDLRGEPSGHALDNNLQVPLLLKLTLEEVDPLLGVGVLLASQVTLRAEPLYGLEQIILLLPWPLGLRAVRACPLAQGHEPLLSLVGIIASILLPNSEVGQLLGGGGKLSHLLTGGSELCN